MKIRKHTYYKIHPNLEFHQLDYGPHNYTSYIKDPSIRSTLSEDGLHFKNKNTIILRLFRVYNNFYIKRSTYNFTTSYYLI